MQPRIKADHLYKRYSGVPVLEDVSLEIRPGECLAIFGRSGSGKSALLRLLAGDESADSGVLSVEGRRTMASFEDSKIENRLKLIEWIQLFAAAVGIPAGKRRAATRDALALVGLEAERGTRMGDLSYGLWKLARTAVALMPPSDFVLLDEPMAGLDYASRRLLWEELLALRARERRSTVIATSRTEDAELCDRVVLLDRGRVLAIGTVDELKGMADSRETLVVKPTAGSTADWMDERITGVLANEENGSLTIELESDSRPIDLLRKAGSEITSIRLQPRGIDFVLEELSSKARSDMGHSSRSDE